MNRLNAFLSTAEEEAPKQQGIVYENDLNCFIDIRNRIDIANSERKQTGLVSVVSGGGVEAEEEEFDAERVGCLLEGGQNYNRG